MGSTKFWEDVWLGMYPTTRIIKFVSFFYYVFRGERGSSGTLMQLVGYLDRTKNQITGAENEL